MKILYTQEQYSAASWTDLLSLQCEYCNKTFTIIKTRINSEFNHPKGHNRYCSNRCAGLAKRNRVLITCKQCNIQFEIHPYRLKIVPNPFCSYACSASYNIARRTNFSYVSQLEKWISEALIEKYPRLEFHFNHRDTILMELDIYIPSLHLAFEINGPSHYQPIYGKENLAKVKWNDARRKKLCEQAGICLHIIDTSEYPSFKIKTSQPYLDTIVNIIDTVKK